MTVPDAVLIGVAATTVFVIGAAVVGLLTDHNTRK